LDCLALWVLRLPRSFKLGKLTKPTLLKSSYPLASATIHLRWLKQCDHLCIGVSKMVTLSQKHGKRAARLAK